MFDFLKAVVMEAEKLGYSSAGNYKDYNGGSGVCYFSDTEYIDLNISPDDDYPIYSERSYEIVVTQKNINDGLTKIKKMTTEGESDFDSIRQFADTLDGNLIFLREILIRALDSAQNHSD